MRRLPAPTLRSSRFGTNDPLPHRAGADGFAGADADAGADHAAGAAARGRAATEREFTSFSRRRRATADRGRIGCADGRSQSSPPAPQAAPTAPVTIAPHRACRRCLRSSPANVARRPNRRQLEARPRRDCRRRARQARNRDPVRADSRARRLADPDRRLRRRERGQAAFERRADQSCTRRSAPRIRSPNACRKATRRSTAPASPASTSRPPPKPPASELKRSDFHAWR